MKLIKYIIVGTLIVIGGMCLSHCQDNVSISIYQDAKLAFVGDDKGNDAFTPNILTRVNFNCKQDKNGYGFVFPEFEYAALQGGEYFRYSLNGGYTFNQIIPKIEASLTGGIGMIHRNNVSGLSLGCSGVLSYKLGRFSPSIMLQLTDRYDLNKWRTSGFIGIKYN